VTNELHSSPAIIMMMKSRRMWQVENVSRMRDMRNAYKTVAGTPERRGSLGKPKRRWEYIVKGTGWKMYSNGFG